MWSDDVRCFNRKAALLQSASRLLASGKRLWPLVFDSTSRTNQIKGGLRHTGDISKPTSKAGSPTADSSQSHLLHDLNTHKVSSHQSPGKTMQHQNTHIIKSGFLAKNEIKYVNDSEKTNAYPCRSSRCILPPGQCHSATHPGETETYQSLSIGRRMGQIPQGCCNAPHFYASNWMWEGYTSMMSCYGPHALNSLCRQCFDKPVLYKQILSSRPPRRRLTRT